MQPAGKRLRVIVLEDNDVLRTVLSELLSSAGYEVFSYADPSLCPLQEAGTCNCRPGQTCADVIISDLGMPGMDGLRFVEMLREKNCRCRHMAVMSGLWKDEELRQAKRLNCKVLFKPFQTDAFFSWLRGIEEKIDPDRTLCRLLPETG
jgi:CheY-like chemotaxis protein